MDVRRPSVAGQFYEGSAESLRAQIEECFRSKIGPGSVPTETSGEGRIRGLVVPHAGYMYSGPVAAWSYSALFQDRRPQGFVILGPNHHGIGSGVALYREGAWRTPLGDAEVDSKLAESILRNSDVIDMDETAHAYEHSIEVQLPFIQYLFGKIRFVPISMMLQDEETAREVGRAIAAAVEDTGMDVVVVASSDFSHYVPREVAEANDGKAIQRIIAMDISGLYRVIDELGLSMCGYGPVAATIEATTSMGAKRGRLLKYATSGDVVPMGEVVGYASIAFEKG